MFVSKQNKLEDDQPFMIVHNYRSSSTRSSKGSKRRRIRKFSEISGDFLVKKHRKMTENIEVKGILQEEQLQLPARSAFSQAQIQPEQTILKQFDIENFEQWGTSDLEKIIPVDLRQDQLDEESPLGIYSFHNKCQ